MQKKVQIVSDGSLDLPQELTREKDIEVVPFYVSFDSETYKKEVVEIGIRDFYQEMVDHPDVFPKSSMPSVDDFYHAFEKSAKENIPVICICITKKFSGSLQSATVAKGMIEEKYPQAKITVIDSTINTVLQGLFVLEACRLRDMGMDYEEIIEKILPVVDNFERGLAAVPEEEKDSPFADGMTKIYKQMMTVFEEMGVKAIDAVGEEFNPDYHNAVMHVEDEEAGENVVVEEFQKGYLYKDHVVRHSMVKVAN